MGPPDSLSPVAALMARLSDTYGVSGHEGPVRDVVRDALPPAWRRQPSRVDSAGDLIIEAGPERDTAVFIAHLDEIGFRILRIRSDGTALLAPLGGFYSSLWEGQPALVHLDGAPSAAGACRVSSMRAGTLPGIFVPRAQATTRAPDTMSVWLGVDSAALTRCGVGPGVRVSGYKHASRLGPTRLTARAIDDRAGCTALLRALTALDPARLSHKVIFIWSVREEVGLDGAAAAAAELGPSVRRVYAVDTFVSSDAPLESRRFAYAPLGAGPALRSHDNSSVTPPDEVARAAAIAARAHIPVQIGTTNGGNDGSTFVPWGAVDVAVGWPLRYSHSPAEVADLHDVDALGRLVAALASADNGPAGPR